MDQFDVYKDIQARTGGEIYIGVVGPVRTGKSTFIRRFMEHVLIPNRRKKTGQCSDEVPVSGKGKMITTVEPKFIPKNALNFSLEQIFPLKCVLLTVWDLWSTVLPDIWKRIGNVWLKHRGLMKKFPLEKPHI